MIRHAQLQHNHLIGGVFQAIHSDRNVPIDSTIEMNEALTLLTNVNRTLGDAQARIQNVIDIEGRVRPDAEVALDSPDPVPEPDTGS